MSDINDGGPAFPDPAHGYSTGMSLRDWFAGQALAGSEAAGAHPDIDLRRSPDCNIKASYCYAMADAMLAARKAVQP